MTKQSILSQMKMVIFNLRPNRKSVRNYSARLLRLVLILNISFVLVGGWIIGWLVFGFFEYGGTKSVLDIFNPKYNYQPVGFKPSNYYLLLPFVILGVGLYQVAIVILEFKDRKRERLIQAKRQRTGW